MLSADQCEDCHNGRYLGESVRADMPVKDWMAG